MAEVDARSLRVSNASIFDTQVRDPYAVAGTNGYVRKTSLAVFSRSIFRWNQEGMLRSSHWSIARHIPPFLEKTMISATAPDRVQSSPVDVDLPATAPETQVQQARPAQAKESNPAFGGLKTRLPRPTVSSSVSRTHATRAEDDIAASGTTAKTILGKMPPRRANLNRMPTEIALGIGAELPDDALLQLSHTSTRLRAQLSTPVLDTLIASIRTREQYGMARDAINALPVSLRANRLLALREKIFANGPAIPGSFNELVNDWRPVPPDDRGRAVRSLASLIPHMNVNGIDLTHDQLRAHASLLEMAKAMSPSYQRETLQQLLHQSMPASAKANVEATLAALETSAE